MSSSLDRRRIMMLGTVSFAALVGAGVGGTTSCSSVDVNAAITTVLQFIQGVQKKVTDGCQALGKLVPTVDFIVETAAQVIGTALNNDSLPKAVADIDKVVAAIIAQCSAQPSPTPQAGAAGGKFY